MRTGYIKDGIGYIPLTRGKTAMVSIEDFEEISKYQWYTEVTKGASYARRSTKKVNGKAGSIKMHQAIMGKIEGMEIDHISRDGLDNRRGNLRHCAHRQNEHNKKLQKNNTSGYKGVSWNEGSWRVQISYNSKAYLLGRFSDKIEAAKAYNKKAIELCGEFAWLNPV